MRHHDNLNLTNEGGANLVSHLCPRVPARIPPSLPRIRPWAPLWKKGEGLKRPRQTPRLWRWVTLCKAFVGDLREAAAKKTSRQVWNSESVQWRGGVFADHPLVHPRTPAPSLWCLCVFVNEEILIPWWDIALSWAAPASSMPSTSAQSYSRPTQPQSHQASGFTFVAVRETSKSRAITDGWLLLFYSMWLTAVQFRGNSNVSFNSISNKNWLERRFSLLENVVSCMGPKLWVKPSISLSMTLRWD